MRENVQFLVQSRKLAIIEAGYMNLDIMSIIIGAGIVQGFFFGLFLLLNKKGNKRANFILAFLLIGFSLSMIHTAINMNNPNLFPFFSIRVREPFLLLVGPLLLLYIKELVSPVPCFKATDLFHGIPFLFYILLVIPFYYHPGLAQYVKLITLMIWGAILIQNSLYFHAIKNIVKVYEERIKNSFSDIDKISLNWINFFTSFFLGFILFFCLGFIILMHKEAPFQFLNTAIALGLSFAIYGLGYKGLFQIEVFKNSVSSPKAENPIKDNSSVKYKRSGLKEEESRKMLDKLLIVMQEKKPFYNPDLTLPMLAEILDIQPHYLSQIINEQCGANFYDFINKYRVEEVKKLLLNPEKKNESLLTLAFDAGFNSKPAFNSVFKRFTGLTPSQYKKNTKIT